MQAVYICRNGNNEEMRFSLRSLDENLSCVDDVIVFGGKPPWCCARYVPLKNLSTKHSTGFRNIMEACTSPLVEDTFVYMNDDFYITEEVGELPPRHCGPLRDRVEKYERKYPQSKYTANMRRTLEFLEGMGIEDPLCYELHIPMVFEKEKLAEVLELIENDKSLQYRTIYGNLWELGGEYMKDVKVYEKGGVIPAGSFVSSIDTAFGGVGNFLREVFPNPSRWEVTTRRSYLLSNDVEFEGRKYPAHSRVNHQTAVEMSKSGVLTATIR